MYQTSNGLQSRLLNQLHSIRLQLVCLGVAVVSLATTLAMPLPANAAAEKDYGKPGDADRSRDRLSAVLYRIMVRLDHAR